MHNDEFYIGWMQRAPASIARFFRIYLLLLLLLVVFVGVIVATKQKTFSSAKFEFGQTTEVDGIYRALPVPHLAVKNNHETILIPLVGYGKHGAEGVMEQLAQEKGTPLINKKVRLRGTLLYGNGKLLLQIDRNDNPLVGLDPAETSLPTTAKNLGEVSLRGEVIDPKCYFGVMKPGEGKVHKDCAIRCIAGGIPPVLAITNDKGEKNYVLLIGTGKERLNDKIKDYVAVPSTITGKLMQLNNWLVMEVKEMKNEVAVYKSGTPEQTAMNDVASCCQKIH